MANYTAADIKSLRESTGAGMLDVKKALDEAEGDQKKAIEILRVKGLKGIAKREGRTAANGVVLGKAVDGKGTLVEINVETDFVAKSDKFVSFAEQILDQIVNNDIEDVDGLLASALESGETVQDLLTDTSAALGEKVEIRRIGRLEGGAVSLYLHRTSRDLPPQVGVLFATDKPNEEVAHDVALHIAAFPAGYLTKEDVPEDVVANERRLAEETAKNEGKPEQALPKIVEGRLQGYFKENVLLEQAFAKDNKKSIKQILDEAGLEGTGFVRFRVGV